MLNWGALGSVAESIGAVGVIATLAYLALQVRRSNLHQRADANQTFARDFLNLGAIVMDDQNIKAYLKGLNSYWDLTPEERFRFESCAGGFVNLVEANLYHAEAGKLEEVLTMQQDYLGPRLFAYPGVREWWKHLMEAGSGYHPDVNKWVGDQIDRNRSTQTYWDASAPDRSA